MHAENIKWSSIFIIYNQTKKNTKQTVMLNIY